ncbi:anaphase-promoting complex subunit 11 RING-H2 finger-domain-containing protein [Lentinula detonsa]|uniref:Anaphase-promoting complex subunit 11 n=1 Tax=Lentinula detonsa TaxID=2804962 RepID=A0A9W8TT51_9AGAR|nr:anaphase-promoting complex subunit 11 RING-H2 finger-domain-containing protein [Lentinula detonsa]KAJ3983425.1 anaphase-promoting complex subunit 11 RING-H2 finger-domain-containing protein [Lentinula detonsa]
MKVEVKHWHAVAQWRWDTGVLSEDPGKGDDDEGEVCGICRVPFEGCCPVCKVPGDDCPLIWGECSHVFHMHCLLKWIGTQASKQQCPMDRRPWVTAERKVGGGTSNAAQTTEPTTATSSATNPATGPTTLPPVVRSVRAPIRF